MAVLLGNDYLVWIESAVVGTYNAIKGQGSFNDNRSQAKIDTSDKTSAGFATGAYGLVTLTASMDIKVNLPDVNGYSRLETKCNLVPAAPFNIQVRSKGSAGVSADSIFTASVYGTITSRTFNKDGTVDAKVEFSLAAAPSVDTLA